MNNQRFYTLYQVSPGTLIQHSKCQIKYMFTPRLENKEKIKCYIKLITISPNDNCLMLGLFHDRNYGKFTELYRHKSILIDSR